MKWQVNYALANLNDKGFGNRTSAEYIGGDVIKVIVQGHPDVLAAISDAYTINKDIAIQYVKGNPEIDFICGYRKECVWEGEAITYLKECNVGWGNFGTLHSAAIEGNANFAAHKTYSFAARLIHQYGVVVKAEREYDRIFKVTLRSGRSIRIGMIPDYEPTSDNVRSLWEQFGAVDIAWNINPNGTPSTSAIEAGKELGCKVLKTDGLKTYMQSL
jgi:hypothetical protein